MTIKIEQIKLLDNSNVYSSDSYPLSGFYIVNQNEVIYVNKTTFTTLFICFYNEIISFTQIESKITEELFLKSLAVASGKVEDLKLNK